MKQESVWELSYHRKKRHALEPNHVTVAVIAESLGIAIRTADAQYGEEWNCWTARHVGRRVILRAGDTSGEETGGKNG